MQRSAKRKRNKKMAKWKIRIHQSIYLRHPFMTSLSFPDFASTPCLLRFFVIAMHFPSCNRLFTYVLTEQRKTQVPKYFLNNVFKERFKEEPSHTQVLKLGPETRACTG